MKSNAQDHQTPNGCERKQSFPVSELPSEVSEQVPSHSSVLTMCLGHYVAVGRFEGHELMTTRPFEYVFIFCHLEFFITLANCYDFIQTYVCIYILYIYIVLFLKLLQSLISCSNKFPGHHYFIVYIHMYIYLHKFRIKNAKYCHHICIH